MSAYPELQLRQMLDADVAVVPQVPAATDILAALEPPAPEPRQARSVSEPGTTRSMNYVEREARNQALGEAFVMNDEQARMIYAGKENPGEQLEQISATVGPAARSAATTNVTYT